MKSDGFRKIFIYMLLVILTGSNFAFAQNTMEKFDPAGSTLLMLNKWQYCFSDSDYEGMINDSRLSWSLLDFSNPGKLKSGVHWLKKEINIEGEILDTEILRIVFFNIPSAFEVYWDGVKISANGRVGKNPATERNGRVKYSLRLGKKTTLPGEHTLILHVSDFEGSSFDSNSWVLFGYESVVLADRLNQVFELSVYMGLFFAAFLFSISVYILGWRDRSFLFLGGFTLFYLLICLWYFLVNNYAIDVSTFRLLSPVFEHGHAIALIILVFFTLAFYEIKFRWIHFITLPSIALLFALLSGTIGYRITVNLLYVIFTAYSLLIALSQIRKKVAGSFPLIFAMFISFAYSLATVFMIISESNFPQYFLFNLFENIAFVSFIMIAVSRKIQDRNRKYREALLLSHRLESELLKKSIQPHFIMNTLLSLKSWLMKDQHKAERIIDALATQFRIINRISPLREIPINEEIELCKLHLELMGYRFDADYKFEIKGGFEGLNVPPLVFHTLVENALTHSFLPKENGSFWLSVNQNGKQVTYKLTNNGSQIGEIDSLSSEDIVEGLGLKYVKTRLEENYPGKWKLKFGVEDHLWAVEINCEI